MTLVMVIPCFPYPSSPALHFLLGRLLTADSKMLSVSLGGAGWAGWLRCRLCFASMAPSSSRFQKELRSGLRYSCYEMSCAAVAQVCVT